MIRDYCRGGELDSFLASETLSVWFRWPGQLLAALCAVVVTVGGLHLIGGDTSARDARVAEGTVAAGQFAEQPRRRSPIPRSPTLPRTPLSGVPACPSIR